MGEEDFSVEFEDGTDKQIIDTTTSLDPFHIEIRTLTGKRMRVEVHGLMKISEIKAYIEEKEGL